MPDDVVVGLDSQSLFSHCVDVFMRTSCHPGILSPCLLIVHRDVDSAFYWPIIVPCSFIAFTMIPSRGVGLRGFRGGSFLVSSPGFCALKDRDLKILFT